MTAVRQVARVPSTPTSLVLAASFSVLFRVTTQSEGEAVRGASFSTSRTSEELRPRRLRTHSSMGDVGGDECGASSAAGTSDGFLSSTAAAPAADTKERVPVVLKAE